MAVESQLNDKNKDWYYTHSYFAMRLKLDSLSGSD